MHTQTPSTQTLVFTQALLLRDLQRSKCASPQHTSTVSSSLSFLLVVWQGRQAAGFTTGLVKCTPGNLAGETCSHCTGGIQIPLYPDAQLAPVQSHRHQAASGVLRESTELAAGSEGPPPNIQ